jgi:gliding motility-associated-like protein
MARLFFITIAFLSIATVGHAQFLSEGGRFQVDQRSGCAPLTINISIVPPNACNSGSPCDMDWNGDSNYDENLVFTHTYTTAGSFWLKVLFQSTGEDSVLVEVIDDIPPAFSIYTCGGNEVMYEITDTNYDEYVVNFNDGSPEVVVPAGAPGGNHIYAMPGPQAITVRGRNSGAIDNCTATGQPFMSYTILPTPIINSLVVLDQNQIQIDFTTRQYVQYKLEMATNGNTSFQPVEDIYNATNTIVPNLDTENNYYCFRLGVFDPCNPTLPLQYSNVICSADLSLDLLDNMNRLQWATHTAGIANFTVERDNAPYASLPGSQTSMNDTDVECKTEYTYQLISNYSNGSTSYSLIRTGTAVSTTPPTPVQNISAVVNGTSVELSWAQDPAFDPVEYVISRRTDGSGFAEVGTSNTLAFTDAAYPADQSTCYHITYTDVCDNTSTPSLDACPMVLSGEQLDDGPVLLTWSAYEGWALGVQGYVVEKYTDSGFLLDTFDAVTDTTFTDNTEDAIHQVHIYVVRATANEGGLSESVSNVVVITREPRLTYPAAFTPNGDGLNDHFIVHARFVNGFRMSIFNRWGELIYVTDDITQGWDGTRDGKLMPEGTYTFRADLVDYLGRAFVETGAVLLLRR